MDGNVRTIPGNDFFSFDIDTLSDFAGSSLSHSAVSGHVRRYLDRIAVGKGLKAGIEWTCRSAHLHVQRPGQKKRA
jgi:hypothetical protein